MWTNWIEDFRALLEPATSPEIYKLWAGISGVGIALERRAYTLTGSGALFPNMFNLLVGIPGTGKNQAIDPLKKLLIDAQRFKIGRKSLTRASMIDDIAEAKRVVPIPNNLLVYHSLTIIAPEFAVFCPAHDTDFLAVLNDIYDNPTEYSERRRTGDKKTNVEFPQINLIGGVQPSFLGMTFPEQAWTTGITSRLLMVYSGERVAPDVWAEQQVAKGVSERLISGLRTISGLHGPFTWTDEAKTAMQLWNRQGLEPAPLHSKLQSYSARRIVHMLKLCMIAGVARTGTLTVDIEDYRKAQDWLLSVEQLMPDIFREMSSRSDNQVIEELHFFMWRLYSKEKRPIVRARLVDFLRMRLPADKIYRLLQVAEQANIIARVVGTEDHFIPRPKHEHGME